MIKTDLSRRAGRSRLNKWLLGASLICAFAAGLSFLRSEPASAMRPPASPVNIATVAACERQGPLGFFGLEPWYHFLPDSEIGISKVGDAPADNCGIKCFNLFPQDLPNSCGESASDVPGVILAIIDDLLRVAAMVAVAFVIIGSFQYTGSRGNSEKAATAQSTIISALTGLGVALVSVALVSFIGAQLH